MRDRETIDAELRLRPLYGRLSREQGGQPGSRQVDELLDERLNSATSYFAAKNAWVPVRARRGRIR